MRRRGRGEEEERRTGEEEEERRRGEEEDVSGEIAGNVVVTPWENSPST